MLEEKLGISSREPKAPDCTGVILEISVFTQLQFPFHFHLADNSKDPLSSVIANTSLSSKGFGRGNTCRDSFLRRAGRLTLKRGLFIFLRLEILSLIQSLHRGANPSSVSYLSPIFRTEVVT